MGRFTYLLRAMRLLLAALSIALLCMSPSQVDAAIYLDSATVGTGPYYLDVPNETYILTEDITTTGSGFIFAAQNVTLDLGGQTVTYSAGVDTFRYGVIIPPHYPYSPLEWSQSDIEIWQASHGATVRNGRIVQSLPANNKCCAVKSYQARDITVEGLEILIYGDDSWAIQLREGRNYTIHGNTIVDSTTVVTNRHAGRAAIDILGFHETSHSNLIRIYDNTIHNCAQWGIRVNRRHPTETWGRINNNRIYPNTKVTNGYGIGIHGAKLEVYDNVIVAQNGRGIHLDGEDAFCDSAKVYNNYIDVVEISVSGEYPRLPAHGIKLEHCTNTEILGNYVISRGWAGSPDRKCDGDALDISTGVGSNNRIYGNTFIARHMGGASFSPPADHASAVRVVTSAHDVVIEDNTFITNDQFLRASGWNRADFNPDPMNVRDTIFLRNTWIRCDTTASQGGPPVDTAKHDISFLNSRIEGLRFVDNVIEDAGGSDFSRYWLEWPHAYSEWGVSWSGTIRTSGSDSSPAVGIIVEIRDAHGTLVKSVVTDHRGEASIKLDEYSIWMEGSGANHVSGRTEHNQYQFTALFPGGNVVQSTPITTASWLVTISATPDHTPPSAVSNLAVASTTQTMALLTWTAVGDDGMSGTASQYDIRRHSSPITTQNWAHATQIPGAPAPGVSGTAESMTVEGLQPGTTYHFAMKVADEVPNWSALSNQASGTTQAEEPPPDTTPPAGVGNLNVPGTTQTTATLTWTAVGDDGMGGTAFQYDVRRHSAPITAQNWAQATQIMGAPAPGPAGTPESMIVTGLQPATTYHFAMKVADEAANWSALSNQASGTTQEEEPPPDTTPPSEVGDLGSTGTTQTTATLSWTAVGNDGMIGVASQYDIRRNPAPITTQNWAQSTQITPTPAPGHPGATESMVVTGLQPGTVYYFAMKVADDAPNWSGLSNQASCTTQQEDPPPPIIVPPATIGTLAVTNYTKTTVTLTWTAVGGNGMEGTASQYDVRHHSAPITSQNWSVATQIPGSPAPSPSGTVESMVVAGLQPATVYHFAMKVADDGPNWSGLSNQASCTTQPEDAPPPVVTPPAAVDDLAAGTPTDSSITLTWTAVGSDGLDGTASLYDIRRHSEPITEQNWPQATQIPGAPEPSPSGIVESMMVVELQPGTVYHFAMKTANEVPDWSPLSNQASETTRAEELPPDTIPPAVTTDLAVTREGEEFLVLSWTAPSDGGDSGQASSYDLRYAISPVTEATWHQATPAADLPAPSSAGQVDSCRVEGLEPGTLHYFALRAADEAANWSELSNSASGSTLTPPPPPDTTPPSAVSDLHAAAIDTSHITLTWTAPRNDGEEGTAHLYNLRYSLQSLTEEDWDSATEVAGLEAPHPPGSSESFTVNGLEPGTLYYFAVKTADEALNWSELSNLASAETDPRPTPPIVPDLFGPARITDLAVVDSTETSLTLRWTSPADSIPDGSDADQTVAGFTLRYMTSSQQPFEWDMAIPTEAPEPESPGTVVYWTMDGLLPSTTYQICVRSWDSEGNWSSSSNAAAALTVTPSQPPPPVLDITPPAAINTLAGFALGPTTLRLTWMAVGDDGTEGRASRYLLRWLDRPITTDNWQFADSLPVPDPAPPGTWEVLDWGDRAPGNAYYFAVRALDAAGNASPLSPSIAVRMPLVADEVPPAAPTGLVAQASLGRGVLLSWDPSPEPDLAGYQVLRRRADRQDHKILAHSITAHTFVDSTVSPGLLYAYATAARDASGNLSQRSGEVLFLVPVEPDADANPLITAIDLLVADPVDFASDLCRLRWSTHASENLLGFRVYRERIESVSFTAPAGESKGMESLVLLTRDDVLRGPGPHVYELCPLPEPGCYHFWIEAVGGSCPSVWLGPLFVEIRDWNTGVLAVRPNPTSGPLQIIYSLECPGTIALRLYDVQGRQVGMLEQVMASSGRGVLDISDLRSLSPSGLSAGVFFARMGISGNEQTIRVVLTQQN